MRRRLLLYLLPILLLPAGCFRDSDPVDVDADPLQVHAVIAAGSDSVTVLLSRPEADRYSYEPVSGADVRISHDGGAITLREHTRGAPCAGTSFTPIGDGPGCYTGRLPDTVQPGDVYDLDIVMPGGARATGRTKVPTPVAVTAPDPGHVYHVTCAPEQFNAACHSRRAGMFEPLTVIALEWDTQPDAGRVEAVFTVSRVVKDGVSYAGQVCQLEPPTAMRAAVGTRGRLRWPIYSVHCSGPIDVIGWDTVHVNAVVAAYDSAYGSYMDAVLGRDAARIRSVSAGVTGALGVFGAVSTSTHSLALVRND